MAPYKVWLHSNDVISQTKTHLRTSSAVWTRGRHDAATQTRNVDYMDFAANLRESSQPTISPVI